VFNQPLLQYKVNNIIHTECVITTFFWPAFDAHMPYCRLWPI